MAAPHRYLAVSPKALYAELYDDDRMVRQADEVRIGWMGDVQGFCRSMRDRIDADHISFHPAIARERSIC